MFKSHYLHITLINLSMLPPARPHNTDNDSNDNNNAKVYISNINKNVPINFYLDWRVYIQEKIWIIWSNKILYFEEKT